MPGSASNAFRPFEYAMYDIFDGDSNTIDLQQIPPGLYEVEVTVEIRPAALGTTNGHLAMGAVRYYAQSDDTLDVNPRELFRTGISGERMSGVDSQQRVHAYFSRKMCIPNGSYGRVQSAVFDGDVGDDLEFVSITDSASKVAQTVAAIDTKYVITRVG